MKTLNLSHRHLSSLDAELNNTDLASIEFLYCRDNYIQWLPSSMSRMSSLRVIDLTECKFLLISNVCSALKAVTSLKELWLDCTDDELNVIARCITSLQYINGREIRRGNGVYISAAQTLACVSEDTSTELEQMFGVDIDYDSLETACVTGVVDACSQIEEFLYATYGTRPLVNGISDVLERTKQKMCEARIAQLSDALKGTTIASAVSTWDECKAYKPSSVMENNRLLTMGDIACTPCELVRVYSQRDRNEDPFFAGLASLLAYNEETWNSTSRLLLEGTE